MCKYGYCRISKAKQSIERQIRNIKKEYPEAVIIQEAYTGTTTDRKESNRLFNKAKKGDTIIFDSVSRMSRNAEEGFKAYEELFNKGVELVFLKEPQINTNTYKTALSSSIQMTGTNIDYILKGVNQFLLELAKEQIKLAFIQAEKEVEDLHQRTKEGIATARLAGKQIGREKGQTFETKKSITAKEQIKKHAIDFGGTLNDIEVIKLTGLSRNTYYKYKREIKAGSDSPATLQKIKNRGYIMALDIETIGYFLYMEEQEREQEQDKDYSFRCNNEDNKENEVSIWQE